MTEQDYYSVKAISASGLKALKKSPAHFKAMMESPPDTSAGQLIGSATHCAILEPDQFDNRYTVMPDGLDRRSNAGKEAYAQILASGKEPLPHAAMADIRAMQESALAHPIYARLLTLPHEAEREYHFTRDGVAAKMKADLVIPPCAEFPNGLVVDLKTCGSAENAEFTRIMAIRMDMHIQASFYTDHLRQEWNTKGQPEFWWFAIEAKAPYLNALYRAPASFIEKGREEVDTLMQTYIQCLNDNEYPGYTREVSDLAIPDWFYSEGEVTVEFVDDNEEESAT